MMISKNYPQKDLTTTRRLLGVYEEESYNEIVILEFRLDNERMFNLFTKIKGKEYAYSEMKFFYTTAMLLDHLPLNSTLKFRHELSYLHEGKRKIGFLDEHWSPYKHPSATYRDRDTGTVVYKLKFTTGEFTIESNQRTSFAEAAEELREKFPKDFHIEICYYCDLLIDYSSLDGTDLRIDNLICFRDKPELLEEVRSGYPKLMGKEPLLVEVPTNIDALHSCSAFKFQKSSRF